MRKRNCVFWVWLMTRLGKANAAFGVVAKFATENGPDVGRQPDAIEKDLYPRGNNVMLDRDAVGHLLGVKQTIRRREIPQTFRAVLVEIQFRAEFFQFVVGGPIHLELVEQHFHVGELVVVAIFAHQFAAPPPKVLALIPNAGNITSSCM